VGIAAHGLELYVGDKDANRILRLGNLVFPAR